MGAAARAAHHTHTGGVNILAVLEHIVQENVSAGSLIDMGAAGVVSIGSYFFLALAPAIEVEVYADCSHAGQRSQALLLVLAVAHGPMAVGADNKGVLTLHGRGVDGAKQMLPGGQLDTDVLGGIAIVLAQLREDYGALAVALLVLCQHARVEEGIQLQSLAYFAPQRVTPGFPLGFVVIERGQVVEHHLALLLMAARIFIELDLIQVATLLPPVPVEVLADVVERHFYRIGTHAEVGIRQSLAHGVDILVELELHAEAPRDVLHDVVNRSLILGLKGLGHRHRRYCHQDSHKKLSHCQFSY